MSFQKSSLILCKFVNMVTRRERRVSLEGRHSDLGDTVQLLQWTIKERKNYVEPDISDHDSFIYELLRCDW